MPAGAMVTAVEIDRDLVAFLEERFAEESGLRLISGDASELDWSQVLEEDGWKMLNHHAAPVMAAGPPQLPSD